LLEEQETDQKDKKETSESKAVLGLDGNKYASSTQTIIMKKSKALVDLARSQPVPPKEVKQLAAVATPGKACVEADLQRKLKSYYYQACLNLSCIFNYLEGTLFYASHIAVHKTFLKTIIPVLGFARLPKQIDQGRE
jgi:hypothetical protein